MYRILLALLLFSAPVFSQTYSFDHVLEYQHQCNTNSEPALRLILTNSADNSYYALVDRVESDSVDVYFKAENEVQFRVILDKDAFFAAETLNVSCGNVYSHENHFKFRTKEYAIQKMDSTDASAAPETYVVKNTRPKEEKKLNLARLYMSFRPGTEYHLPVLLHSTVYEEWKQERTLPNGIFESSYKIDSQGDTTAIYKLQNIYKTERYFKIEENCSYLHGTVLPEKCRDTKLSEIE